MESSPPAWGAWAQRAKMPPSRSRCRRAFSALSILPVPTPALPQPQADGRSPAGDAGSWSSGGDACGQLKISPSRTPGRTWPSCRHKILIGGSSAAPSHWPRDKPSAGRGRKRQREGAAPLTAGMGGRHRVLRARRAPAALLLLGLQMLAPGVKLWLLSGRSRRVLRLSASSLAGSSATWKTTGVSLVWSGLDPFCLPGPSSCKCTRVEGGAGTCLPLPGWGFGGNHAPGQGHPDSAVGLSLSSPLRALSQEGVRREGECGKETALPAALLILSLAEDSGGRRRWVMVGRCCSMSPAAWDLDEPVSMETAPANIPRAR